MNQFLAKKKTPNSTDVVTEQIKSLGFLGNTSVNELAAKGVQISVREAIIQKLKEDKERQEVERQQQDTKTAEHQQDTKPEDEVRVNDQQDEMVIDTGKD